MIKRVERNKRKFVTHVIGLEHFGTPDVPPIDRSTHPPSLPWHVCVCALGLGIELKKAAKKCAGKFACGASVTKSKAGVDEIVIQGDVADGVRVLLLSEYSEVRSHSR